MQAAHKRAELDQRKNKLANSYTELIKEFSAKELRHVGNYTVGKLIGKGSFGKVYLARHDLTNGSRVVLKASSKDDANLAREIHHHRQFIHPHIARLYEVIVTESLVWLVLEYCPGDELYNYLVRTGPLPVETTQKIFTQLVGAVSYIHSKSCVHRDLKLENVLLDKNENVKLCDFGFTREYEGKTNYLSTFCGTICYSAPEMLRGERYAGEKVDVWSLGIILYALLKGELPFDDDDDQLIKAKIMKEEPSYPDTFPDAAKTLVSKLLSKRSLYRPSLSEILADPFLADHAPQQQAILKLTQPAPFTTPLEKSTLERMKAAGVDVDKVIENVLSQRCDSLAGWWVLLMEKETRKEARRERKRKEREAEGRTMRRLSAASSRPDRMATPLEEVREEGKGNELSAGVRARSTSRGRTNRRSTPQILVSDLPRLPEGSTIESSGTRTPPPPVDKDPVPARNNSRPPIPPKERRRRSSNLQLSTSNSEATTTGPPGGVTKRRFGKHNDKNFMSSLKQWFRDTTKRNKATGKNLVETKSPEAHTPVPPPVPRPQVNAHRRQASGASNMTRASFSGTLTPIMSHGSTDAGLNGHLVQPRLETRVRAHRSSLSPSPLTPQTSSLYKRSSTGLRGRKSTSSSISSIRSIPKQSHSKHSSVSSASLDTINSPGTRSVARSPHSSIKVLPATPTVSLFALNSQPGRSSDEYTTPSASTAFGGSSVMFARRKKSPFKGPSLNSAVWGNGGGVGGGPSSPAPFGLHRGREPSDSKTGMGLADANRRMLAQAHRKPRKSQIIVEEEEGDGAGGGVGRGVDDVLVEEDEEFQELDDDDDDGEIEEVDAFPPVDLKRGESVHSIVIWDDPPGASGLSRHGTGTGTAPRSTSSRHQRTFSLGEHTEEHEDDHGRGVNGAERADGYENGQPNGHDLSEKLKEAQRDIDDLQIREARFGADPNLAPTSKRVGDEDGGQTLQTVSSPGKWDVNDNNGNNNNTSKRAGYDSGLGMGTAMGTAMGTGMGAGLPKGKESAEREV